MATNPVGLAIDVLSLIFRLGQSLPKRINLTLVNFWCFTMLLSIIIPFYNSADKSSKILDSLERCVYSDVEWVLVDDGSTDSTFSKIEKYQEKEKNIRVIKQRNRGPGSARNAGLRVAKGEYIWFVDSDDNIYFEAIEVLRSLRAKRYDFIDFNVQKSDSIINTMNVESGEVVVNDNCRIHIINGFGRIWSKIIRADFIHENRLYYLGRSFTDDSALTYVYPMVTGKFYKSKVVAYLHDTSSSSITRSRVTPRFFDRLNSAECGLSKAVKYSTCEKEIEKLKAKFVSEYLVNTVKRLIKSEGAAGLLAAARVSRQYREMKKRYDIKGKFYNYTDVRVRDWVVFLMIFPITMILGPQDSYLKYKRLDAWGVGFPSWPEDLSSF